MFRSRLVSGFSLKIGRFEGKHCFPRRLGCILEPCGATHSGFQSAGPIENQPDFQERAMKKCPQCEFIYEDDQSLCDMDGVLLVFDSRTLPNLHAMTTVSAPVPGKTSRRNRMVPAFATLILMVAVGSIYFVSTTLSAAPENIPPVSISSHVVAEAPVVIPPAPAEPATAVDKKSNEEPREVHAAPTAQPARRVTTTTTAKPVTTKPDSRKDDSKVGSILKKTGKILKKPFKF